MTRSTIRLQAKRKLLFLAIYFVFVALVGWCGLQLFWWSRFGVAPLAKPDRDTVLRNAYPELWRSGVLEGDRQPSAGQFNVLLLGASVLEQCAEEFRRRADVEFSPAWNVYSVAVSAHSSRDSWLKYDRIQKFPFQLIVFYHAINESRMNCCPKEVFREDYRHCGWYDSLERRLEAGTLNLIDVVGDRVSQADANKIPLGEPETEWLAEGADLKTPPAFRANVERILAAAKLQQCRLVLVTFAVHLPENYTEEKYRKGELNYGEGNYQMPARVWGLAPHVKSAVEAHNAELRTLAKRNPDDVWLIDLAAEFPRDGNHFSDPCHLTSLGVAKWNEIVFRELRRFSQERESFHWKN